ncbi:DUF5686 and carboxypeptidase-like regulatory domain-containing protein [soil metagenome]
MIRNLACIVLFIFICPLTVFSQSIYGTISDADSEEPLSSATILHDGTYRGTIANLDGEFSIEINQYPAVLLVRYIGYESERIELSSWSDEPLHIELNPSVTEMDEIIVTDRDPGLSIMERVIERKKIWRADLKTYEVDAFTRQVLRNDTSIVSITESGTRSFWHAEEGHREVQLYRRQTTNIGEDQNFAGVRFLPDFYDDNIRVAGFNMVGITHPNALSYYDFQLLETLQIDGQPVYKIEVIPKRRLQPLFEGVAYILGGDYALLEVNVKPNEVVTFPSPVQEFDLTYRQQFSNFGENFWLPVDMHINGTIRISMIGLRFPSIRFSQTSTLSEYKVNVALPDSLYQEDRLFSRAVSDTVADFSHRLVPLTDEEQLAYETIDSTDTLEQAFEPEGFLAKLVMNDDESSFGMGSGQILPAGVGVEGRFNRVDGFNLGLNYEQDIRAIELETSAYTSYSFHAKSINYGASFRQKLPVSGRYSRFFLKGSFNNDIRPRSVGSLYAGFMNTTQSLVGGIDYFDYYKTTEFSGGFEMQRILPRTDLSIQFTSRDDRSLMITSESVHDYSLFGLHQSRQANNAIWDGKLNYMQFELDLNRFRHNYGVNGSRAVRLVLEHSTPQLGSDFEYTSVNISANWNIETFFSRRIFPNTFDLHLSAGHAFGEVPPQRLNITDGAMGKFAPFGTLKTIRGGAYEGSTYWLLTGEHNFRTIPFEIIGLRILADRGMGIIIFGGAGYSTIESDLYQFMPVTSNGVHSEAGISLNSIFGLLRIDFAKRLDAPGSYIGFSLPRYF